MEENPVSLENDSGCIAEVQGKTVDMAYADIDDLGYGFVLIQFTDGTWMRVNEVLQCGRIGYTCSNDGIGGYVSGIAHET